MNSTSGKDFVVCIPARYASMRLPGKPLIKLSGKELILWAIESASKLGAREVVVATDDTRIFEFVEKQGYEAVMTSHTHKTGTDRLAECARIKKWSADTMVLNYQGDEPNIPKENVLKVIEALRQDSLASIATMFQPIENIASLMDENIVKVVTNKHNRALYFSRAPIPWKQHYFSNSPESLPTGIEFKQHVGLYVYTVGFLEKFSQLKPCQTETAESLEQLRALYAGETIVVVKAEVVMPHGIDTPDDIRAFEKKYNIRLNE
ncbi:MAG: 3-deoxy-manno-octulosonate cytidylyltransferase [Proteobacteria bacterium]|nr:3-deoxy-manno-octulosonate cytidylyltransferase [Pseudomonadota bacterium]